jgi:hypothetical protein
MTSRCPGASSTPRSASHQTRPPTGAADVVSFRITVCCHSWGLAVQKQRGEVERQYGPHNFRQGAPEGLYYSNAVAPGWRVVVVDSYAVSTANGWRWPQQARSARPIIHVHRFTPATSTLVKAF